MERPETWPHWSSAKHGVTIIDMTPEGAAKCSRGVYEKGIFSNAVQIRYHEFDIRKGVN